MRFACVIFAAALSTAGAASSCEASKRDDGNYFSLWPAPSGRAAHTFVCTVAPLDSINAVIDFDDTVPTLVTTMLAAPLAGATINATFRYISTSGCIFGSCAGMYYDVTDPLSPAAFPCNGSSGKVGFSASCGWPTDMDGHVAQGYPLSPIIRLTNKHVTSTFVASVQWDAVCAGSSVAADDDAWACTAQLPAKDQVYISTIAGGAAAPYNMYYLGGCWDGGVAGASPVCKASGAPPAIIGPCGTGGSAKCFLCSC